MSEEPQNCPFCGADELLTEKQWVDDDTPERWAHKELVITCVNPECRVKPSVYTLAAWNRLAVVPDGWVLVPEEPTEEMEVAIWKAVDKWFTTLDLWDDVIAAAPKPEEVEG